MNPLFIYSETSFFISLFELPILLIEVDSSLIAVKLTYFIPN